jgi:hypothetical protein
MSGDPSEARVSSPKTVASAKQLPDGALTVRKPLDDEGRYRDWGRLSLAVVIVYLVLIAIVLGVILPRGASSLAWVPYFLAGLLALLLVRYLSTHYSIDDSYLRATKLLGGRRIALEEVRKIEFASLRDLVSISAMSGMGAWGWHGRQYSTLVGEFDSIYTDPARGLLITAGGFPLYISPHHLDDFARELSRRVRSYTGPLVADVGVPGPRQ